MRILLINLVIFLKNTDSDCYYMMVTPFYDKPYEKNMKNLQTKIYLAFFSDFEYHVPLPSNEIFFRISSEKTYCTVKITLSHLNGCPSRVSVIWLLPHSQMSYGRGNDAEGMIMQQWCKKVLGNILEVKYNRMNCRWTNRLSDLETSRKS